MTPGSKHLRIALSIPLFLLALSTTGQIGGLDSTLHASIEQKTDQIFDRLVKIRRDLHAHPELSGEEALTSKWIAGYLGALGFEVKTDIGGHGIVGIMETNRKGKKIAWRADIDALESNAPDPAEFKSQNQGIRHICGHDVNTAIAIGIAEVLSSLKNDLNGTIYFIFQPSEENYRGAKAMIDDGLFKLIKPDEVYALHIAPMPAGLVATRPDWLYADYRTLKVSYRKSKDDQSEIEYTKNLISSLQNVAPDSKFWDTRNLLDPNIGLANPNTIYKDYQTVNSRFQIDDKDNEVSIRTFISTSRKMKVDSIENWLSKKVKESVYSKNLTGVECAVQRPVISNDKQLTTYAMSTISSIIGANNAIQLYGVIPDGRGDDFAYFQNQVRGVYFLLGGSNFEKGIISMPHSPEFAVDENCIKTGVKVFSSMIVERLRE